jgi:hypothetical protein
MSGRATRTNDRSEGTFNWLSTMGQVMTARLIETAWIFAAAATTVFFCASCSTPGHGAPRNTIDEAMPTAPEPSVPRHEPAGASVHRGFWFMTADRHMTRVELREGRATPVDVWQPLDRCMPETVWRTDANRAVGVTRGLRLCVIDQVTRNVSVMNDRMLSALERMGCSVASASLSRSGTLLVWCFERHKAWIARDVMRPGVEPTWTQWDFPAAMDFRSNFIFAGRDDVVFYSVTLRSPIHVVDLAPGSEPRRIFTPGPNQGALVLDRTDTRVTLAVQEHANIMQIRTFDLRGVECEPAIDVACNMPARNARTVIADGFLIAVPEVMPWVDVIDLQAEPGMRVWQRVNVDNSVIAAW